MSEAIENLVKLLVPPAFSSFRKIKSGLAIFGITERSMQHVSLERASVIFSVPSLHQSMFAVVVCAGNSVIMIERIARSIIVIFYRPGALLKPVLINKGSLCVFPHFQIVIARLPAATTTANIGSCDGTGRITIVCSRLTCCIDLSAVPKIAKLVPLDFIFRKLDTW